MNISSGIKAAKNVVTANSPVLLLGTAIAGVVTTGVLAARAGYQARGIIDAERDKRYIDHMDGHTFDTFTERQEHAKGVADLDTSEKIKLTWLCYAAPAVTGASTIASVAGLHTIHTKRMNAMAALYAVTSTKLDDMGEKAEELLGAKKSQQLHNELAQKAVDRNPIEDHEVIITGNGTELMFDDFSGRWFDGSVAVVENAVNEINRQLIEDGSADLNEYYDHIGLKPIPMGSRLGWGGGDKLDVRFGGALTPDGRSAVSVTFRSDPKDNINRY